MNDEIEQTDDERLITPEESKKLDNPTAQSQLENCIPSYEKGYQDGVRDAMELVEEMGEANETPGD